MNTVLRTSTCRQPSRQILCVALGLLVSLSLTVRSASAQNDLTVRIYTCPAGQARATADRLRTEFGLFAGVRIAADERTSQVIVQARRKSNRASANDSRPRRRPPGDSPRTGKLRPPRSISQYHATLCNGRAGRSRFVEHPGQSPHRDAIATATGKAIPFGLSGGEIEVTIDPTTSRIHAEGAGPRVAAFARLIQVLDSPSEAGGRDVRVLPLKSSPSPSIQQVADVIRSSTGPQPSAPPLAAMLFQPREGADAGCAVAQNHGQSAPCRPRRKAGRGQGSCRLA